MSLKPQLCQHLVTLEVNPPDKYECDECVKTGDTWVHLRKCQSCGTTLCCDSSPNQHARKHAEAHKGHSVIISAEPGEKWSYCFEHKSFNPEAY